MRNEESLIQRQCVSWFRIQYPSFAKLLYHIPNEGSTSKASIGGIRKAEGLMAGAPDLMLNVPAKYGDKLYHSFGIEMKTAKGRQSPTQRQFQAYFEAAGNHYFIVRSFDEFCARVSEWMNHVPQSVVKAITKAHEAEQKAEQQRAKSKLQRLTKRLS